MGIVNKPVQVVTTIDKAGLVKPVCFFVIEDDGTSEVINVERLIRRDKEKIDGRIIYTFTCEIIKESMKVLCDLRLDIDTDEWTLYRI